MNICFAKVTPLWPHLFLDTVQHKHATWGEGEIEGTAMAEHVHFLQTPCEWYGT